MKDIKYTLSRAADRTNSIEEELKWLRDEGSLSYSLSAGKPQSTGRGNWIYFIRGGELVGRARIKELRPPSGEVRYSYANEPYTVTAWEAVISEMELATSPIPHKGFQGFRYVTDEERSRFEASFAANAAPIRPKRRTS